MFLGLAGLGKLSVLVFPGIFWYSHFLGKLFVGLKTAS